MREQANNNISYWGGCPTCGGNDGCMTDSVRDHWYYYSPGEMVHWRQLVF